MTSHVIKNNLLRLTQDIVPYTPKIVAVTKYYDVSAILDAYEVGLRMFGESRAVDAIKKIEQLPDDIRKDSQFHFIGHLQTNKVDKVVRYFDCIQSVDSLHLAKAISESAIKLNKVQTIFLQVNISREVQKFGFEENELESCVDELKSLKGLKINGLMCMAPLGADEETLNKVFSHARELKENLSEKFNLDLQELSMGMSDDYKIAVKNGATMIRIGRLLFSENKK